MTRPVLLAVLVLMSATASAELSARDKAAVVANVLLVIDWGQTRYVANNPDRYEERNPVLGRAPSAGEVDRYFVAAIALTNALGYLLPEEYGGHFYIGVAAMQTGAVFHNYNLGIKIDF